MRVAEMKRALAKFVAVFCISGLSAYAEQIELKCKTSKMKDYFTYAVDTVQGTVRGEELGLFETIYFSPTKIIFRKKFNGKYHSTTRTYDIDRVNLDYKYVFRHDCYYQNPGSECDTRVGFGKCYVNKPNTQF